MVFHEKENIHVNQVTLKVVNMELSLDFYRNVIGFQVWKKLSGTVYLSAGDSNPILVLEEGGEVISPSRRTNGLYHFALLLSEKTDLADLVKRLIKMGVQVGSSDHLVSEAVYFSDPDGNGIEVYIDRPSSMWEWRDGEVKMAVAPLDFEELFRVETNSGWLGLPERTVVGHIHLHVSDLDQAKQFYCDGLGFDIVSRLGNQSLFISSEGYYHHIGLNTWKGVGAPPPDEKDAGMKWYDDIHYPDSYSRQEAVERMEDKGSPVREESGIIYTTDPSKNNIRLLV